MIVRIPRMEPTLEKLCYRSGAAGHSRIIAHKNTRQGRDCAGCKRITNGDLWSEKEDSSRVKVLRTDRPDITHYLWPMFSSEPGA